MTSTSPTAPADAAGPHAASSDRRRRLREAEDSSSNEHALKQVSNAVSLEKYYSMAERLLWAFHSAVDDRRLDDAYVLGLRFASFSMDVLPRHVHYHQKQYVRHQQKNARQVQDVVTKLESVTRRMDVEELLAAQQNELLHQQRKQTTNDTRNSSRKEDPLTAEEERERKHRAILQQQRDDLLREQHAQRARQQAAKEADARQDLEQRARDKLKALQQKSQTAAITTSGSNISEATNNAKRDSNATEDLASRLAQLSNATTTTAAMVTTNKATHNACTTKSSSPAATTSAVNTALMTAPRTTSTPAVATTKSQSPTKRQSMDAPDDRGAIEANVEVDVNGNFRFIPKQSSSRKSIHNDSKVVDPPSSPTSHLTPQEAKTVRLLHETIRTQEARLARLEASPEPVQLRALAKHKLQHGNDRKGALFCLYKRRKILQSAELIKHAIFKMETQLLWLESAAENRNVALILDEASQEMEALQQGIGNLGEIGTDGAFCDSLVESTTGVLDDEDLLSELMDEEDDKIGLTIQADDDISLLSLPTLPSTRPEPKQAKSPGVLANLF